MQRIKQLVATRANVDERTVDNILKTYGAIRPRLKDREVLVSVETLTKVYVLLEKFYQEAERNAEDRYKSKPKPNA